MKLFRRSPQRLKTLAELQPILQAHQRWPWPEKKWLQRSAVAVILREDSLSGELSVLLMRRAIRLGDPWSGDMSFPGGKLGAQDACSQAAALRELQEEVGITPAQTCWLGQLPTVMTRRHEKLAPMLVEPFVFQLLGDPTWQLNHEAQEVLWVPLAFFADSRQRQRMTWPLAGIPWPVPCYFYQERRIWGLTLLMLDQLVRWARHS